MPDSNWTRLGGEEARRREAERGSSNGFGGWERRQSLDPPAPRPISWFNPQTQQMEEFTPTSWRATKTETFARLFYEGVEPPEGRSVIQYCDRCEGHVDTLVDAKTLGAMAVPFQPAHVEAREYGHRAGNLYLRYRVRGTLLRRTVQTDIEIQAGGRIESEEKSTILWERKRVDHVERGPHLHWLTSMQAKDCQTRLDTDAFGYRDPEIGGELVAVLREHGLGKALSLLDDGEAIAQVAAAAAELDHPTFAVVPGDRDEELALDLLSHGDDAEPLVHGRLTLGRHEGGFFTITSWKPQTNAS